MGKGELEVKNILETKKLEIGYLENFLEQFEKVKKSEKSNEVQ